MASRSVDGEGAPVDLTNRRAQAGVRLPGQGQAGADRGRPGQPRRTGLTWLTFGIQGVKHDALDGNHGMRGSRRIGLDSESALWTWFVSIVPE